MMMDEMIENNFYCQPKRIRKQFRDIYMVIWDSLVSQTVKRLPTMWETQVQSLCWEDPLQKEMATHAGILAWEIPWLEEPGRLQSMGFAKESDTAYGLSSNNVVPVLMREWEPACSASGIFVSHLY